MIRGNRVQKVRHSQSTELLHCRHLTDTELSLIMTSAGIWVSEARVTIWSEDVAVELCKVITMSQVLIIIGLSYCDNVTMYQGYNVIL